MSERRLEALVDEIRRGAADGAAVSDGELLARFLESRDPAAFELLVWRHGAMVQAVCRRVLGRSADVDDALQATFLVLLRQAKSIRRHESLAGWLHCVALRVAQRCRRANAARWRREKASARSEALSAAADEFDLGPLLHAEIDRLSERLRAPFVLCVLEGKTNEEATRLLGVPHGTVLSRLSRARERLRQELLRRGVTAAAVGALAAIEVDPLSAAVVDAAVRVALSFSTGTAAGPAAALAQGVIHAMVIRKLTIAASAIAATFVLGIGLTSAPQFAAPARAQDSPKVEVAGETPKKPDAPKAEPPKNQSPLELMLPKKTLRLLSEDESRMLGTWGVVEVNAAGENRDPEDMQIVFGPFGTMLLRDDEAKAGKPMTYKLGPEANPPAIELTANGKTQKGIYQFTADGALSLCLNVKGDKPSTFDKGANHVLFTLRHRSYSADTKWADAMFVKGRSHDFGALPKRSERVTHKFTIKNIYDRPIAVSGVTFTGIDERGQPMGGGAVPAAGPGGGGPMAPGGGIGPGGAWGNSTWATVPELPQGWLQPGEETTLEILADQGVGGGPQKVVIGVTFQVRGITRPAVNGPAGPVGTGGGGRGGRGQHVADATQSTAGLIVTADWNR
jgi:RNA polymerase sigma factor (sigma-70 family)